MLDDHSSKSGFSDKGMPDEHNSMHAFSNMRMPDDYSSKTKALHIPGKTYKSNHLLPVTSDQQQYGFSSCTRLAQTTTR